MKKRHLLIGNGVNIQFGGATYSNQEIISRVYKNIKEVGRYKDIVGVNVDPQELVDIFDGLAAIFDHDYLKYGILHIKDASNEKELRALVDISRRYKHGEYSSIGFEDYFLIMRCFNNRYADGANINITTDYFLRLLFLDAISNCGKIDTLYYRMNAFKSELEKYSSIFTVNYDSNLDKLLHRNVFHLHGEMPAFSETGWNSCLASCSALMSYCGERKRQIIYSSDLKECFNTFLGLDGELSILGMSPNNDKHIFEAINTNKRITSVVYYYVESSDYYEAQIVIKKPIQLKNAFKFWSALGQ